MKEQATQLLINAVIVAQSKGAYSLEESSEILKAIKIVTEKEVEVKKED